MVSNPTVLLVHGSWHKPIHYQRQIDALEDAGFPASCPLQPSVGKAPPIGLKEDAQMIRDELSKLIEAEGKDVVVIAHSYGGVVTAEAVDTKFSKSQRAAAGQHGGVIQLLYVCAFVLPVGESLASAFGNPEKVPDFIEVKEDGMCLMRDPAARFYNDIPEEEQKKWVDELVWCPATTQLARITQASYLNHPSSYLFCEDDQAMPLAIQQKMVDESEKVGAVWKKDSCNASHSPFLSNPEHIINSVRKIATTVYGSTEE
jgi:hypothetical protein